MIFKRNFFKTSLVLCLLSTLILTTLVTPTGNAQTKTAPPSTHVVDNAGALDGSVKQQLENILSNLLLRGGINFVAVIVQSTSGRDIYDFSFELAKDWDIGLRTSVNKSLLLVVATGDKVCLTQNSKGV